MDSELELAVVLKRKFRTQNWTEMARYCPSLLMLCKNPNDQVKFEAFLAVNYICINSSQHVSLYLLFHDLAPVIRPSVHSEYKELRLQVYKFLSLVFEKKFREEFLQFLDVFEEYLQLHIDEEAMAYIMEVVIAMSDKLTEGEVLKFVRQASEILEKAVEKDLILYCLKFISMSMQFKTNVFKNQIVNSKLVSSLLGNLSNEEYFEGAFEVLTQIYQTSEMIPIGKEGLSHFSALLFNKHEKVAIFASEILVIQSRQGFEYLENMINKNFIPTLVIFLTSDQMNLKKNMIFIVKSFFQQQLQHQIIELLENNVVNILCRIIERDLINRLDALECMELLLNGGNEIFKSFADSCRLSKLLVTIGGLPDCHVAAVRIAQRHYPKVVIPAVPPQNFNTFANIFPNPPAQGINTPVFLGPPPISNAPVKAPTPKVKKVHKKTLPKPYKKKLVVLPRPPNQVAGKLKKGLKKNTITTFPASRLFRRLKQCKLRISKTAPIYLAGVLDYLCSEILDISATTTMQMKRKRIIPKDIFNACRQDSEFDKLLPSVIMAESGHSSIFDKP